jgi:hypothetical protein
LGRGKKPQMSMPFQAYATDFARSFTESVVSAAHSTLYICAYITFFSVFMSSLSFLMKGMSGTEKALFYGFFEMSGGVSYLKNREGALFTAALIVFWSGVSVLMQIISALSSKGERISVLPYLAVRAVCIPLGAVLTYIICVILHLTT